MKKDNYNKEEDITYLKLLNSTTTSIEDIKSIEDFDDRLTEFLKKIYLAANIFNEKMPCKIIWVNLWNDKYNIWYSIKENDVFVGFNTEYSKLDKQIQFYNTEAYKKNILSSRNYFKNVDNEILRLSFDENATSVFTLYKYSKNEISKIVNNIKKNDDLSVYYQNSLAIIKNNLKDNQEKDYDSTFINKCKFINWIFWVYNLNKGEIKDSFYFDSTSINKELEDREDIKSALLFCNIGFNYELSKNNNIEIESFIYQVKNFLNKLRTKKEQLVYQKLIKQQMQKNSISAIMSRNMSHNLGSHVISGTKSEIYNKAFEIIRPHAIGTYRLLQYIQERMDFLSVIINYNSNNKEFNAPLNLKADILDEFAVDGRGIRHNNSKDLSHSYLLNHIVSSEKITRESKGKDFLEIEIQLLKKTGDEIKCFTSLTNGDNDSNEFNEINFSIPLGVNSRHAFLTILENYIRNIAKHKTKRIAEFLAKNRNGSTEKLFISILVEEDNESNKSIDTKNDKYRITIFDNLLEEINKIDELNARINMNDKWDDIKDSEGKEHIKILNNDNTLNKYNKGLKEMLVCSYWLKGLSNDWSIIEQKRHNLMEFVSLDIEILKPQEQEVGNKTIYNKIGINNKTLNHESYSGISFTLPKHYFYFYKKIIKDDLAVLDNIINDIPSAEIYIFEIEPFNMDFATLISKRIHKVLFLKEGKNLVNIFNLDNNSTINIESEIEEIKQNDNKKEHLTKLYQILYKDKFDDYKIIINYDTYFDTSGESTKLIARIDEKSNYNKEIENAINPVFFTTHNDSTEIFVKNITILKDNGLLEKIKYIEGISGGNFTYNLLCNAPIDTIQYYRILESAMLKIAIIDERIYNRYKDVSFSNVENEFTENQIALLNNILDYYKSDTNDNRYSRLISDEDRLFEKYFEFIGVENTSQAHKSWLNTNNKITLNKSESYNKLWLRKKNIFIFNIAETNDTNKFNLLDIEGSMINQIENSDFLSIHYGILEKFNIKNIKEFLKNIGVNLKTTKICIHSGRGGIVQLQDTITFIPVSSIDAQMDDSKYKLSQMFLNLKYKPIDYEL